MMISFDFLLTCLVALSTREDFPHLLGEMRIVLIDDSKFETNLLVSGILFVKSSSRTSLPNVKGTSIASLSFKFTKNRLNDYL